VIFIGSIVDEAGQICLTQNRHHNYHLLVWQFETYVAAATSLDDSAYRVRHSFMKTLTITFGLAHGLGV
jgi:hypothetical protein